MKKKEQFDYSLRQSAEEIARQTVVSMPDINEASFPEAIRFALHELRVHQIELEMQNEELSRTQEILAAARERYFNFFELAPVGYFTLNKEGLIIEANLTLTTMLGVERGALLERPISSFICRGDQDIYYRYNKRLLKGSGRQLCELRLRRKDGTDFWAQFTATSVMEAGTLEVFRTVVSDVTELKQGQKALAATNDKYSKVFSVSPEALLITRLSDGTFLDVNQSFTTLFGYSRDETLGKTAKQLGFWVNYEERNKWAKILAEKNAVVDFEAEFRLKDGSVGICLITASLLELDGEKCILSITRDITERRKNERELDEYRSELEMLVANRTAELQLANKELEAFSYSVSHDLKAPLRSILGFSMNLLQECSDRLDSVKLDELNRIKNNAEKMSDLIDDLLKLSKIGRAQVMLQQVDLSQLAQESLEECQILEPGRNIEIIVEPGLTARGDSQLLKIFFANMIGNAWKYSGKKADAKIEFGSTLIDDTTAYYVRDNGAGFDMEYVDKLFTPFQRLHKASEFPGTGIGLVIMARIIERHLGKIWAEGAEGEGATFYFTIGKGS